MTKDIKTALFYTDVHYPYHEKTALSIVLQIGIDAGIDILINGGDAFDANGISKFTKKKIENGVYETGREIEGFKKHVHDPLIKALKPERSLWCGGNHCTERVKQILIDMDEKGVEPELIEHYKGVLNLSDRFPNTEICEYNQFFRIGKMLFTHGTYHGQNHARQTAIAYGTNVTYGHLHTNQVFTHSTVEGKQPREATAIGCMCIKNPPYMKNSPSAWCNSFAIYSFLPNGEYSKEVINIINGKAIFRGKIYKGVKKELSQLVK